MYLAAEFCKTGLDIWSHFRDGKILCYSQINMVSNPFLDQGPVVQSIISLTSSLRGQLVKCFTTL